MLFQSNSRGQAYPHETVARARALGEIFPELSLREIAAVVGVASPSSISNWLIKDMSLNSIDERASKKGSDAMILSKDERTLLHGNILFEDICRRDTSTESIRDMADEISGAELSLGKSFISKFLAAEHLSLRSAVGAHPSERLASKRDELADFLSHVRRVIHGIPDDRVINLDFTSVYSDSRFIRQAGAKGRYYFLFFFFSFLFFSFHFISFLFVSVIFFLTNDNLLFFLSRD